MLPVASKITNSAATSCLIKSLIATWPIAGVKAVSANPMNTSCAALGLSIPILSRDSASGASEKRRNCAKGRSLSAGLRPRHKSQTVALNSPTEIIATNRAALLGSQLPSRPHLYI
jgi:hypothetical protein